VAGPFGVRSGLCAGRERALDLVAESHLALARPEHPRHPEEGEMPKAALEEVFCGHRAGRHVVGEYTGELRFLAALEEFHDGLAGVAIDLDQPLIVDLADDAVRVPVAEPLGEVLAGVPVNAAVDAEQPGERRRVAADLRARAASVHVALARRGDDAAQHASRVGELRWEHQRHPHELRRTRFLHVAVRAGERC
jgi:hypothetical protein